MAEQTSAVSKELLVALRHVHVTGQHKRINSLRQALRNFLSEEKINNIGRRLDTLRSELNLRVLVSLKKSSIAQSVRHDARLGSLEVGLQDVIRDILDGNIEIMDKINQTTAVVTNLQRDNHSEVMAKLTSLSIAEVSARRTGSTEPLELTISQHKMVEEIVLDQLNYRHIRSREHQIDPAHEDTFQWIFGDTSHVKESEQFASWLLSGGGIFWIRGKAASGKSTLMKLIADSLKTRDLLGKWAGKHRLLIASFYFWNLGTALQKSQSGLLRSLLLSLLRENRYLIQQTLPDIYTEISKGLLLNGYSKAPEPLSDVEVKMGFLSFVQNLPTDLRVCVLIDGLDEYEGNVTDLLELLLHVTTDTFKMVVSSRPIPRCVTALKTYPHMRLEQLTRRDILRYTEKNLLLHPNARYLLREDSESINYIVQEVVHKADGVFLWVTLVVKLLLEAMGDNDGIEELQKRLDALPPDLTSLYRHMMEKMTESHRKDASWYLQMVLRSVEVQDTDQMNLLHCWLAEAYQETTSAASSRVDKALRTSTDWEIHMEWMEGRLLSLCCGLVETEIPNKKGGRRYSEGSPESSRRSSVVWSWSKSRQEDWPVSEYYPTVAFIHKSVADFLRQPDVWTYLTNLTNDKQSNMYNVLARSSLLYMKSGKLFEEQGAIFARYSRYCLQYLRAADPLALTTIFGIMSDLRAYITNHPARRTKIKGQEEHYHTDVLDEILLPGLELEKMIEPCADLYIAAYGRLPMHFQHFHKLYSGQHPESCLTHTSWLLRSLLEVDQLTFASRGGSLQEHVHIARLIVEQGIDVNATPSPWQQLFSTINFATNDGRDEVSIACLELVPDFVRSGASLQSKEIHAYDYGNKKQRIWSAMEILERFEAPSWAKKPDIVGRARLVRAEIKEIDPKVHGRRSLTENGQVRPLAKGTKTGRKEHRLKNSFLGKLLSRRSKDL